MGRPLWGGREVTEAVRAGPGGGTDLRACAGPGRGNPLRGGPSRASPARGRGAYVLGGDGPRGKVSGD